MVTHQDRISQNIAYFKYSVCLTLFSILSIVIISSYHNYIMRGDILSKSAHLDFERDSLFVNNVKYTSETSSIRSLENIESNGIGKCINRSY